MPAIVKEELNVQQAKEKFLYALTDTYLEHVVLHSFVNRNRRYLEKYMTGVIVGLSSPRKIGVSISVQVCWDYDFSSGHSDSFCLELNLLVVNPDKLEEIVSVIKEHITTGGSCVLAGVEDLEKEIETLRGMFDPKSSDMRHFRKGVRTTDTFRAIFLEKVDKK